MQFHIFAVGGAKKGAELTLAEHYLKQIKPAPKLVRIADAPASMASAARKAKEAESIRAKLPEDAFVIALDAAGNAMSSEAFATSLIKQQEMGRRHVACLIGGQDGLDASWHARADMVLAFGPMIWPHKLAFVMLCEQLFRAQCIMHHHPYHKGH